MSSKVTCSSCGHSWSKSDSSKKDASVCHICGKDNTMKDGGWLDKYQEGGEASKYIQNVPKTFGRGVAKTDSTKVTNKLKPTNARLVTQEELDEREAQARRDRISVANAVQPYMFSSPKNFAVASSTIGDKLRVSDYPNVFDDYVNAASMFGHLASGLGQVPLNIQEGNYGEAALNTLSPVMAGAAETLVDPIISKGMKSGRKAIDQNFTKVGKQLANIEKEGIAKGASPQQIKNWQMQQVGITSLQREGYVPGVSEVFSEYITPYTYDKPLKRVLDIPRRIIKGEKNSKNLSDIDVDFIFDGIDKGQVAKPRYDAWRMYSGLPQEYGTFRMAETSPINHPSYSAEQLSKLEKFSLNDEQKLLRDLPSEYDAHISYLENSELAEALPELKNKLKEIQEIKAKGIDNAQSDFTSTGVMGGYNRRFFDNKMEYNDIWDLNLNGTNVDKYFGKPFLSHGQLDYSFQPAEDALNTSIRVGERYKALGDNITKPKMEFFDAKKLNNLKQLNPKDVTITKKENGGWLEKYNDGGPIQPNYNDYSVSSPEGFQGDGYSNVGRNYSPAWGGQFAMGGSLPGAVGFTYARTGGIPDNGKYAKKTMASAQNGAELENAYAKWPALRNMGPAAVNKNYSLGLGLGYGGVEFMHPDLGEVNYDNGVLLNQAPGKNSTTFNPLTDDAQSVRLDMLHGMHQDPTFSKHRDAFKQSVLSDPSIKSDMDYWYKEDKKKGRAGDGREQWMNNYIDGQMRTLLFEGDRKSRNYSDEEANQLLSNPKIKKNFNKLNDYLKKITKSDKYSFVDKNGDLSLKMKTKGNNPKLTDIEKIGYMWQSPNALKTGDAEGKSEYVNKIKNYYELLKSKKMKQGGQLTKLDQLTNFTNYNTKQSGGWLDKYQ